MFLLKGTVSTEARYFSEANVLEQAPGKPKSTAQAQGSLARFMKRLKLNELQTECVLEVIPRMVPQTKAAIMNGNIMATMASHLFWGDLQGKQHGNNTCKFYKAAATCKAVCKKQPFH